MNKVLSILKLEFLVNRKESKIENDKLKIVAKVFKYIFSFLFATIIAFVLIYIVSITVKSPKPICYCSFLITIAQLILFFYSLSTQTKKVYDFEHKMVLSNLPYNKKDIYLGKTLYTLINIYRVNLLISLPMFIAMGLFFEQGVYFYLIGVLILLFLPIIPYCLANLFAMPLAFITSWLKKHNFINIIISIILTIAIFYIYNILIFNVARIVLLEDISKGNILKDLVNGFDNQFIPGYVIAKSLFLENTLVNIFIFIGVSVALIAIVYFMNILLYEKSFKALLFAKTNPISLIQARDKKRSGFISYFITDFKLLFRSSSYAYTYFGISFAMPIMVILCNKLMLEFAVDNLGQNIVFGTTLLVVLMFLSIICSPTSSLISKEGDNFWLLKTNPKGITIPLIAKSLIGVTISFCSLMVTIILICTLKYIAWLQGLILIGICIIYIIGLVSCGIFINLVRPNLFKNNKEKKSNMVLHMIIGVVISIFLGIFSIIGSFNLKFTYIILVCLAVVLVYTLLFSILTITLNKKLFIKMEA